MALPALKINLRTPYHVTLTEINLQSASIDMFFYTGTTVLSRPVTPTIVVISDAFDEVVDFEISELARDYLTQTFDGSYASNTLWVDYQVTKTVSGNETVLTMVVLSGVEGGGFFRDGINPQLSSDVMMTNTTILKPGSSNFRIPCFQNNLSRATFFKGNDQIHTVTFATAETSTSIIRYISNLSNLNDDYIDRVLTANGTIDESSCSKKALGDYILNEVDKVVIEFTTGTKIILIENIPECQYKSYKITFVNKYGALQDIWFFKRSDFSLRTSEKQYKANIVTAASYNTYDHQQKILTKQGKESLKLFTGFIPEQYNDVIEELLLSEVVWIELPDGENKNITLPVMVKTPSQTFKTHLNDKLIDYEINFEFAFDKVQNIR